MLPARAPDGWWTGHARYRSYVLFAMTGFVLTAVNVLLLVGIRALATSFAAWEAYLSFLGGPLGVLIVVALLVGTLFFAFRFLRVGKKIAAVAIGPMPALSMTVALILNFAGFVIISLVLIVILSGVVV
jgi:fumarate reductase subunit C